MMHLHTMVSYVYLCNVDCMHIELLSACLALTDGLVNAALPHKNIQKSTGIWLRDSAVSVLCGKIDCSYLDGLERLAQLGMLHSLS